MASSGLDLSRPRPALADWGSRTIMRTNMHHLLEQTADRHGAAAAVSYKDTTVGYAELWALASAAANGLKSLGLRRDDRVGIFLEKRVETVAVIFATSTAGGVFVPINPVLKAPQVGYIINDCDIRILVTSAERFAMLSEALDDSSVEHVILVDSGEPPPKTPNYETYAWSEIVA